MSCAVWHLSFLLFAPLRLLRLFHSFLLSFFYHTALLALALWNMILANSQTMHYIYIFFKTISVETREFLFRACLIFMLRKKNGEISDDSPPHSLSQTPPNLCVRSSGEAKNASVDGRRLIFTLSDAENCTGEIYSARKLCVLYAYILSHAKTFPFSFISLMLMRIEFVCLWTGRKRKLFSTGCSWRRVIWNIKMRLDANFCFESEKQRFAETKYECYFIGSIRLNIFNVYPLPPPLPHLPLQFYWFTTELHWVLNIKHYANWLYFFLEIPHFYT